ncbi:MAG: ABC transporter permease [Gemmatimonadota bacterium]|nr:ABC transporter permease [Gemmatimonadota bacterium]
MGGSSSGRHGRLLRFLLYAYPRDFRRKHGDEIERLYRDVLASPPGGRSGLGLAWWLLRDLAGSAIRARGRLWRRLPREVAASLGTPERGRKRAMIATQIRRAFRSLRRDPGFAAVTVLTLGLGIGATTAIFSVVEAVMLRPLPYDEGDDLVWVMNRYLPDGRTGSVSRPEFWEYRQTGETFDGLAALTVHAGNLTGLETPVRLQGMRVSPNYFDVMRTPVARGRSFTSDEEAPGAPDVVVISHRLWRSALGGDPDVLGRTITVDGRARTIVGVTSPDHTPLAPYLFPGRTVDYWLPVAIDPSEFDAQSLELHNLYVVGRLADGATPDRAERAMDETVARLERLYPGISEAGNREVSVTPLDERVAGDVGSTLAIVLAAVGMLLLIACVNVANVLLARGESKLGDASVHAALGAGRGRIALHGIVESLVIGLLGGILGIALAIAAQRTLVGLAPPELPRLDEVGLNLRVLVFAAGVSMVAGLLAGFLPSVRLFRGDFLEALKTGGRSGGVGGARTLLSRGLVVGQVAAAVIVASAAALLGRTLVELRAVDPGFETDGLLMADINATDARYRSLEGVRALYDLLLPAVMAIPGVESATASWQTPLQSGMSDWPIRTNEAEAEWVGADPNYVADSYFETFGIELLRGRTFDATDRARAEGAVILSETAARGLFGDEPAIGRLVNLDFAEEVWRPVVGVVADVRARGLGAEPRPQTYVPISEVPFGPIPDLTLTVDTDLPPDAFRAALSDAMRDIDPNVPIGAVREMEGQVAHSMGRERFLAILLATFAGAALLLGAIGVYGLLAYDVSRRRREIGLRIALGARPDGMLRRFVGRAVMMGAAGIGLGLLGSVATARLLEGLLYGVSAIDAATLAFVAAVVLATAAAASFMPARKAARVDPLVALRED